MATFRGLNSFPTMIFGTMESDTQGDVFESVSEALTAGFRSFDLAERYSTQAEVGRALRVSRVPRSEICLISKVDGMPSGDYAALRNRVEKMLSDVGVEFFDVLLIHYPLPSGSDLKGDPANLIPPESWAVFKSTIHEAWMNMTFLKRDGLCNHCGVSNFYGPQLRELFALIDDTALNFSSEPLAPIEVAQVFVDAAHPEDELVSMLTARGVKTLAYRPLAFIPVYGMIDGLSGPIMNAGSLGNDKILSIGNEQNVEVKTELAPVVLSWLLARGISPVTFSSNPEHIHANARTAAATDLAVLAAALSPISEQRDLIDACGGFDEYAEAFKNMGEPTQRTALEIASS